MSDPLQADNYGIAVINRLAQTPDAVAFRSARGELTYAQLRNIIVRYAAHLGMRGVKRDSCVVLAADRPLEGFALTMALALLGARWVRQMQDLPYRSLGITHVVALEMPAVLPHASFIVVDQSWNQLPPQVNGNQPLSFPGYGSPSDIAFYAQSSGTTGRPKFIAKSFATVTLQASVLKLEPYKAMFCGFPAVSSVGMVMMLEVLLRGSAMIARVDNIQQIAAFGGDLVMASPAQVSTLVQRIPPPPVRIKSLIAFGSMITPQAVELWLHYFEKVQIRYGSQEAWRGGKINITATPRDGEFPYDLQDDVILEIVDDADTPLPPGETGIIRLKTPEMAHAYVDAPAESDEAFRGAWFYPGDLGALTTDNRFRIFGRIKDQFNLGGIKANASDIDEAANRAPGVEAALSFTRTTPAGIEELCVVASRGQDTDPRAVADAIRAECGKLRGKALIPKAIFFIEAIPLNDSGKPARDQAARLAVAGPMY